MRNTARPGRQRGAVIVTVCLLMLFLLGFMGFALDFGRLFIVKTELQTALDSCALSAAQQLDRQANAISLARNAGMTAGNLVVPAYSAPTTPTRCRRSITVARRRDDCA